MKKLLTGIWKEMILLRRDKAGLGILFIMPAILVVIITLVQDSTFQLMQDNRIPVVIVNQDQKDIAEELIGNVEKLGEFNLEKNDQLSLPRLEQEIRKGTYKVGIYIPKGFSQWIHNRSSGNGEKIIAALNEVEMEKINDTDSSSIQLVFDPVMKLSFRTAVRSGLETILARIETEQMMESLFVELTGESMPDDVAEMLNEPPIYFTEKVQDNSGKSKIPSSTQHNVPAWTLFAMFFIVIALGGNIVYEKDQGSFMRLRTLPVSFMNILTAKVLTYIMVCFIQLGVILIIGYFLFPVIGLPQIELPENNVLFFIMTFLIALAATSYGMLVGTLSRTHQQAGSFGAISVMILAALGGIWVPTFAMPDILQKISILSPLNWGLESYYGLFIRNSGIADLYIYIVLFVIFSVCCFSVTFASLKKQGIL